MLKFYLPLLKTVCALVKNLRSYFLPDENLIESESEIDFEKLRKTS